MLTTPTYREKKTSLGAGRGILYLFSGCGPIVLKSKRMSFLEIDFQDLEFYETLGRGAAGSVYKGLWRSKEKIVALKKLNLLENEVEL